MKTFTTTLLIVTGSALFLNAEDTIGPLQRAETTIARLQSPAEEQRAGARMEVVEDRKALIDGLVASLSKNSQEVDVDLDERWLGSTHTCLALLGELRPDDERSIQVLLNNLTYEVKVLAGSLDEMISLSGRYPAAASLIKIGNPAREQVLRILTLTDDPLKCELCAYILWRIDGEDLANYQIRKRLELYKSAPVETQEVKNLKAALAVIERERPGGAASVPAAKP